jgi:CRP-like cAMP-binding protein
MNASQGLVANDYFNAVSILLTNSTKGLNYGLLHRGEVNLAVRTYKRGQFIYMPDHQSNNVYFIKSGRIKIGLFDQDTRTGNVKEIIKSVLHKGDMFGELGLVGQKVRNNFAVAMEKTELYSIPIEKMQQLMRKDKRFNMLILQVLGRNLLRMQKRVESLVFKDAQARVIEFLLQLAAENGRKVGFEMLVPKFYTHQEIANFTSTSRQTVTTTLNRLRQNNLIYFDRRRLLIRNIDRLEALLN